MSQDDQRNQPDEEPAGRESDADRGAGDVTASGTGTPSGADAGAGAGATANARQTVGGLAGGTAAPAQAVPAGPTAATEATAAGAGAAATGHLTASPRREFHDPGDGAPRYAGPAEERPRTGSEQSWSAQPHPGYQPDPRRATTKRILVSSLVGLVVLGAGSFLGYTLLTAKSSNGNGAAPWTGAVEQHGAVVGGINAQNYGSAPAVDVPAGVTYPASGAGTTEVVNKAIEACHIAQTTVVPTAREPGTSVTIGAWATRANPEMTRLRNDATALETAIGTDDVTQVANAAQTLCAGYPAIAALPPMPDAVGSQAWSSATVAYSVAATDALRGASGTIAAKPEALDSLATGNKELDALSARITQATAPTA